MYMSILLCVSLIIQPLHASDGDDDDDDADDGNGNDNNSSNNYCRIPFLQMKSTLAN